MQAKWERRFSQGLLFTGAYAWGKHMLDGIGPTVWDSPAPFAPQGYNRGRSSFDRRHILTIDSVYELPFCRGKRHLADIHPVGNAILGGWQLSGIYNFTSGQPLTLGVPGNTLGNGNGTRPNLLRSPAIPRPSQHLGFDPTP